MNNDISKFTLRVNKELFDKYKYIASYNGRSANKEIEQHIKITVETFEESHGNIKLNR